MEQYDNDFWANGFLAKKKGVLVNIIKHSFIITSIFMVNIKFYTFFGQNGKHYIIKNSLIKYPTLKHIDIGRAILNIHIIDKETQTDFVYFSESVFSTLDAAFISLFSKYFRHNIIIPVIQLNKNKTGNLNEISIKACILVLERILDSRKTKKILFGTKFGCALALLLNKYKPAQLLILDDPFYSLQDNLKRGTLNSFVNFIFSTDEWPNYRFIKYAQKVLFIVTQGPLKASYRDVNKLQKICKNSRIETVTFPDNCDIDKFFRTYFRILIKYISGVNELN